LPGLELLLKCCPGVAGMEQTKPRGARIAPQKGDNAPESDKKA
jgi:hypothetical protein